MSGSGSFSTHRWSTPRSIATLAQVTRIGCRRWFLVRRRGRLRSTIFVIGRRSWRGNTGMSTATGADIAVVFRRRFFFIFLLRIFHATRDDDLHDDFFVDGRHIVPAVAIMEDSNHSFLFAFNHADDAAFGAAVVAYAAHLHQHLITVHGAADLGRRDKDVTLELALCARGQRARLRDDEAVAIAMHAQTTDDQILIGSGGRKSPALFADGNELAAVGHLAEKLLQMAAIAAFESEIVDELLEARDVLGLFGDVREDLLLGDHAKLGNWVLW